MMVAIQQRVALLRTVTNILRTSNLKANPDGTLAELEKAGAPLWVQGWVRDVMLKRLQGMWIQARMAAAA